MGNNTVTLKIPLVGYQQIFQQKLYRSDETEMTYSKYWKIKNVKQKLLYTAKLSFRYEG